MVRCRMVFLLDLFVFVLLMDLYDTILVMCGCAFLDFMILC
jgi:hypothetical protein